MQNSRFLVLTGHLNDYPLSDLVGILRHQQKTGRLLIEYPNGPASFYFNDGELVDAQLDKLTGLQALCVALAQPASSFNFNPLIRPTRRSIENSLQKVIPELLGCWSENDLELEELGPGPVLTQRALLDAPSPSIVDAVETKADEALVVSSFAPPLPASRYSRPILAMAAAGLLMLGLSTVIAVTGGLGNRLSSAPVSSASSPASDKGSIQLGNGGLSHSLPETESRNETKARRQTGKGKDAPVVLEHSSRLEDRISSSDRKTIVGSEAEPAPLTAKPNSGEEKQNSEAASDIRSVKVVLQIEAGRVAKASIANHRSGMEAYEALALRIARQRRYPSGGATQETVTIEVSQPK